MTKNRTHYEKKEGPIIYCDKCGKEISKDGYEKRSLIGLRSIGSIKSRTQLVHRDSEGCKDEVFNLCDDCYKRFKEWVNVFVL